MVLDTLARTKLPARLLKIEITESALFVNEVTARQVLSEIHQRGIQLSLDDFGTGYSSLSFLLSLPVHEIKIDRSFVSDLLQDKDRSEVVRTVIQLGRSLGKQIVAEGAETEQDLQGLLSMGCERVQGYIFSKPQSPAWLADHLWALNDHISESVRRSKELPMLQCTTHLP